MVINFLFQNAYIINVVFLLYKNEKIYETHFALNCKYAKCFPIKCTETLRLSRVVHLVIMAKGVTFKPFLSTLYVRLDNVFLPFASNQRKFIAGQLNSKFFTRKTFIYIHAISLKRQIPSWKYRFENENLKSMQQHCNLNLSIFCWNSRMHLI